MFLKRTLSLFINIQASFSVSSEAIVKILLLFNHLLSFRLQWDLFLEYGWYIYNIFCFTCAYLVLFFV